MSSRSAIEAFQEAMLSQKLAGLKPLYERVSGADPKTSLLIAFFQTMIDNKIIEETEEVRLFMALMDAKRIALFATSERVNEISKMGMQMPIYQVVRSIDPRRAEVDSR